MRCDTCGELEYVLLDGYDVGDRLLEGVLFEIRKKGKGYTATTQAKNEKYMKNLNEKKWLREMVRYAAETDTATCPKCRGDVAMNVEASR